MTCEEMTYSEDYADYLINFYRDIERAEALFQDACVNPVADKVAVLHYPKTEDVLNNLETVPYSSIPNLFGLMDTANLEEIGVTAVQNPGGLGLTGNNVIVGVVDTGIDFTNPLFQKEDGSTRIGMLWDQTRENGPKSPDLPLPFYGATYAATQINEALQKENPFELVPATDENGHGTFLAGVAAGGRQLTDFSGIAVEAELAVVKLKETKPYLREFYGIAKDVPAYEETDIIYGVQYLLRYAEAAKRPISILIGLGSSNGGHLGLTFLERYLSEVMENAALMVSVPAGNEGNERLHYAGDIPEKAEFEMVEINVDEGQQALALEFWGNAPTTFAMGVLSPQGDRIERIAPRFGQEETLILPLAGTRVYIAYQMVEQYSGEELIFVRLQNPTSGVWRFLIYGDEGKQRNFNMWMPLRQFLRPDTYFLRPEPDNTITIPGNAGAVMTMTAYNHRNDSLYANAGRGYNARNQIKPDLAAPGVEVTGPGLRGNPITRTGTSVAAAHSAGMVALFLQWDFGNLMLGPYYGNQIKSFFLQNAVRNANYEYPNPLWGYGIMNVERVFDSFRVVNGRANIFLQQ